MEDTISAYDAKTHLPRLLKRAAQGERITITRHGVPVAVLAPIPSAGKPDARVALERMAVLRKKRQGRGLTLQEIREFIDEGRR
jgi:prevent-host-death family protein